MSDVDVYMSKNVTLTRQPSDTERWHDSTVDRHLRVLCEDDFWRLCADLALNDDLLWRHHTSLSFSCSCTKHIICSFYSAAQPQKMAVTNSYDGASHRSVRESILYRLYVHGMAQPASRHGCTTYIIEYPVISLPRIGTVIKKYSDVCGIRTNETRRIIDPDRCQPFWYRTGVIRY